MFLGISYLLAPLLLNGNELITISVNECYFEIFFFFFPCFSHKLHTIIASVGSSLKFSNIFFIFLN